MRPLLTLALALGLALPARAAPLDPLRDDIDGSAAQVILIWTPEGTETLATGPLRPGGRQTVASDRFLLASVTKPFVAAALLRLEGAGRIDLDAPAAPLLPLDVVSGLGGLNGVTTAQMLAMTSGVPDYLDDAFTEAWIARPDGWTILEALEFAYGEPSEFAPGTGYDYSNTNYLLAQLVLERITGQTMDDALRALVLAPVGADRSGVIGLAPPRPEDAAGISEGRDVSALYAFPGFGDGGLVAPAEDVAATFRALFIDRSVLPPVQLARMLQDPVGEGYGMGIDVSDEPGYGTVLSHAGGDLGYSTFAMALPELPAVAVLLRGDEDADVDLLWEALDLVLDQ
ncbi:serine hydrolase domain-containing protein [Anianabacter salinae]|uniref:serine hydrolase domain-containing protein n=1 Tax=Anianabacter salinae TaxID=2851023 RepID=UPI00225DDEB3|nr:serine hydrolase domain-containing protein [Anianabacter salinae]MBV0912840.1 beta-lactamase family protein [Anianabacter salinae]